MGCFFLRFHGQKFNFLIIFYILATVLKSCLVKKFEKFEKKIGKNFFLVKDRLPLTIFWSEIVSVIEGLNRLTVYSTGTEGFDQKYIPTSKYS